MSPSSSMNDFGGNTTIPGLYPDLSQELYHDLLESSLLAAITSLCSAIAQIESSKQNSEGTNHNLTCALCSLESAIDSVEIAEVASKRKLDAAEGAATMGITDSLLEIAGNPNHHSTISLNTNDYDYSDDTEGNISAQAEVSRTFHDANTIVAELKQEEAALRSLLDMSILLREQDADKEQSDDEDETIFSSLDGYGLSHLQHSTVPICDGIVQTTPSRQEERYHYVISSSETSVTESPCCFFYN